jgi:leucyl aminopeptidase
MRHNGGMEGEAPIAFVGKGITYDSGGLAIKTGGGMTSMRFDMNGAAAVIGAMCAISRQKLPKNVVAVVAACENMVDAKSYRNGDVLKSMHGQTVFVQNTDAEGRLTMADAITYCVRKEKPSEILEVAGLTGSVCNFFGSVCAAALTRQQELFDRISGLTPVTGEKYAQMPAFPEYKALLKSPYADLSNSPAGGPGGILAGLFLDAFSEDVPFLHVDFGAMPFTSQKSDGQPAGGTGFGVRSLYHYVKSRL